MDVIKVSGIKVGIVGEDLNQKGSDADFILAGFAEHEVNLLKEISGAETFITEQAQQSLSFTAPYFCGFKTMLGEYKHLSVAVFKSGRLLDIVDRTTATLQDGFMPSYKIKVYRTAKADAALLIDTDALLEQNWKKIKDLCDVVLCVSLHLTDLEASWLNGLSEKYNIPFFALGKGGIWWRS